MELTAVVVSVNVTKMSQSELYYENLRPVYYTDSEVVIGYISNDARQSFRRICRKQSTAHP